MNKALTTAIIAGAMFATASNANAEDRKFPYWYLGLSAGGTYQSDSDVDGVGADIEWDTGFIGSVSLGYQAPGMAGLRPEIEYSFRQQGIDGFGDELDVHVFAANLYYDFTNSSRVTPYVGAGLGYGIFDFNTGIAGVDDESSQAVYQGMVGIGYEPTTIPNVGLTVGYRYMAPFSDPDVSGLEYEYDNHSVEIGAKFRF